MQEPALMMLKVMYWWGRIYTMCLHDIVHVWGINCFWQLSVLYHDLSILAIHDIIIMLTISGFPYLNVGSLSSC